METDNGTKCQEITSKQTLFLFKSQKDNEPDKYSEVLEKANFNCASIPVLSFQFVNTEDLKSKLCSIHLFSAIIFTSVRAVEAVSKALQEIQSDEKIFEVTSFAVGEATVEAARKAGFDPKGEESGNSLALGEFILKQGGDDDVKPFLYPCSNLHRDTLKEVLTSHGKLITEVVSYETCANERLKEALEEAVENLGHPHYVVFFSPSGFQFTLDLQEKALFPLKDTKIIAIGPTTEKALHSKGYIPFATCKKPDPQSLLEAVLSDVTN